MNNIYSPNNIEVLLHYHSCCNAHPRIDAPAVAEATGMFLRLGCIEPDTSTPGSYRTTLKGAAWVKALCNVEMPREVYADSQGNVL